MDSMRIQQQNGNTLRSDCCRKENERLKEDPAAPCEEFSRSGMGNAQDDGAERILASVSGKKAGEVLFGKRPELLANETMKEYALWGEQKGFTVNSDVVYDPVTKTIYAAIKPKSPSDHNYWHLKAYNTDGSEKWTYDKEYVTTVPVFDKEGNCYLRSRERIIVLDKDGNERQSIPTEGSSWGTSPPVPGPNGEIYFITDNRDRSGTGDANLKLCAYKNGKELWHYNGVGTYGGDHRIISGKDGTVYLSASHNRKARSFGGLLGVKFVETPALIALNPADGSEKFIYKITQWDLYTKGNISEGPDGTIYACHGSHSLVALAPKGLKKWEYKQKDAKYFDNGSHSRLFCPPVFDKEGNIYLGTKTTSNYPEGYLICLDKYGKERWNVPIEGGLASQPQIGPDGKIYCGSSQGKLLAFDRTSGEQKNQFTIGDLSSDNFAFGDNGEVYLTTRTEIAALQFDREKLQQAQFGTGSLGDGTAVVENQSPTIDIHDSYVIIDNVSLPRKMNKLGIHPLR